MDNQAGPDALGIFGTRGTKSVGTGMCSLPSNGSPGLGPGTGRCSHQGSLLDHRKKYPPPFDQSAGFGVLCVAVNFRPRPLPAIGNTRNRRMSSRPG